MSVSIVIPALNEEQSIGQVLRAVPLDGVGQIIVVDNGSRDRTGQVAADHGATVVSEPRRGYGRAVQTGLRHVSSDASIIVVLDADYSDYPEDLPRLINPILSGQADFVVGSRTQTMPNNPALPKIQLYGNRFCCWLINRLYRQSFTDLGPFRAIRKDVLTRLQLRDPNYGWNAEMQLKALIANVSLLEVPVRYRQRVGTSKISGSIIRSAAAGFKIIGTILKLYPKYVVQRHPHVGA